ncbi:MAG TPA: hypothetical protein PLS35_08565, partial [Nitrospira sp.]|nr:hypothetical protein [Nitrospira sp.]
VAPIVTDAYSGRWQVRARAAMKTPPGPWSSPVPFQLTPGAPNKSLTPALQQTPLSGSSVMQAPPATAGGAASSTRPPTTSSQGGASSLFVRPRGVEGTSKKEGNAPAPQSQREK